MLRHNGETQGRAGSSEFHETCHSITFTVLVNSHQRWKQTKWTISLVTLCFFKFQGEQTKQRETSQAT